MARICVAMAVATATAPILPLAWEPPYAMSEALKRQKKKKRKEKKRKEKKRKKERLRQKT